MKDFNASLRMWFMKIKDGVNLLTELFLTEENSYKLLIFALD